MNPDPVASLEALLAGGQDSAVLRFSLGSALAKRNRLDDAVVHLQRAVEFDPRYSAAWKQLGLALAEAGRTDDAIAAYEQGIAAATAKGDVQAGKEMTVFLKRLQRERSPN